MGGWLNLSPAMMERVLHHEGQPAAAVLLSAVPLTGQFSVDTQLYWECLTCVWCVLRQLRKGQITWSWQVGVHGELGGVCWVSKALKTRLVT